MKRSGPTLLAAFLGPAMLLHTARGSDDIVHNDALPNAPNYATVFLAPEGLAPRPDGPIGYTVVVIDPGGAYASYYSAIASNLQAAGAEWDRYLTGAGNLEVEVIITSSVPLGSGGSVTSGFVRNDGTRDIFEQGAAYELRTGIDPNGTEPDIRVRINPDYLTTNLWFDPQPGVRTSPIPPNRTDAIAFFAHELGHAFVFNGWIDGTTGQLPATYMSTFDEWVNYDGSNFFFAGRSAQARYGGAPAVTFGNPFHLGNNPPRPGADLIPDLMNGIVFHYQTRYRVSALDIAIASDCGLAVDEYLKVSVTSRSPDGAFRLGGRGVPTASHRVRATPDLHTPFQEIGNAVADSSGNFEFVDADAGNVSRRFYQVVYP